MLAPFPLGFQVYVEAPLAAKDELCPAQIVAGNALAVITGIGFTFIAIVLEPEHPALNPATV